jgi:hypothetical protein
VEKEKTSPGAAGKKEKRKKEKILDILRDRGKVPGLFLRPMIKQLLNYRSKTGNKTPKHPRGRIVRGTALKRNTGRYRRGYNTIVRE